MEAWTCQLIVRVHVVNLLVKIIPVAESKSQNLTYRFIVLI